MFLEWHAAEQYTHPDRRAKIFCRKPEPEHGFDKCPNDLQMRQGLVCLAEICSSESQQLRPELLLRGSCLFQLGSLPLNEVVVPGEVGPDLELHLPCLLDKVIVRLLE